MKRELILGEDSLDSNAWSENCTQKKIEGHKSADMLAGDMGGEWRENHVSRDDSGP